MRTRIAIALLLCCAAPTAAQVNGTLTTIGDKPVLTVWGTHEERGYAQGYLTGQGGKAVFDDYFVGYFCGGSALFYNWLRSAFTADYAVDGKYQREAEHSLQGMSDAGVSLYNATLGRDIDTTDILMTNAIVDLSAKAGRNGFGCSSLSSWGTSTGADAILAEHLVITRHLDWSKHQTLTDNPLLVVHYPAEADEQPWFSVTYAGLMGALSSVSSSRLAAFLNMGNVDLGSSGRPYHPILLTLRSGMEMADYDGDGGHSSDDIVAAITDRSRAAAVIIHVTLDEGASSQPIVMECNNENGVAVRDVTDNTVLPGDNLVGTNHFRVLYSPAYCPRYDSIVDSLTADPDVSAERSWNIMAGAAGQYGSNIMAIQYLPSEASLGWALDTYTEPAYLQEPTWLDVDELFGYTVAVTAARPPFQLAQNCPNPFNPLTVISFHLDEGGACRLLVHDLRGRQVRSLRNEWLAAGEHEVLWDGRDGGGRAVASGEYLYRLETKLGTTTGKMMLVR